MAAKAQDIVPAGSAQARLGAQLRSLRTTRGLSLARLGAAVHSSPDLVRRVETTERFPTRAFIEACDRALHAGGALASLWPAADEERRCSRPAALLRTGGARFARFAPEVSEQLIVGWAADQSSVAAPVGETGRLRVTDHDLEVVASTLAMFRKLDHTHGAGQFAVHLSTYIDSELTALLSRPAADQEVELGRSRIAAGFLELAGYQAVDSRHPGWAQSYYKQALAQAAHAGERAYGGYLVAVNLGHLALHCGDPRTALRWSQAATAAVGSAASPATRAAILAVSARAHARQGDEGRATTLLLKADSLLERAPAGDEPAWIRYFTRAYFADEMAHCLLDLGRPPAARAHIRDALEGVGRDHVRRLAIDVTLLASSWLRSGDIEQACAIGRKAVEYAARTSSGRSVERIAFLLAELAPHEDHRLVVEFVEYVQAVLPAAFRLATVTSPPA